MSSPIPITPAGAPAPADVYPKPAAVEHTPKPPAHVIAAAPEPAERHHAAPAASTASTTLSAEALSSTDVSYVVSLMGAIPAQKMEELLLKTGVPIPVNLGPQFDATV